ASAIFHAAEIFFRELAVFGKFRDAEIIGAIVSAVGEAFLFQIGDELRHFFDVVCGANERRLFDIQRGGIFQKSLFVFGGVLFDRNAVAGGVPNDFVVHVGDVHDVAHLESALPEEAAEDIDSDKSAEVADMTVVVNSWAAGIHANFIVLKRLEVLYF